MPITKSFRANLAEVGDTLGLEHRGRSDRSIIGVCSVNHPRADHLTFVTDRNFLDRLIEADVDVVVLMRRDLSETLDAAERDRVYDRLYSDHPYHSFVDVVERYLKPPAPSADIHPGARIGKKVSIGEGVRIAAGAIIGDETRLGDGVSIGAGSVVGERVSIGGHSRLDNLVTVDSDCVIGRRCVLSAGVVIGSEGFGNLPREDGSWRHIPQLGRVKVEDDVRIGAGTTVDRAAIDETLIEKGVRLDNLIQIGHNARIGAHTAIAAGTLIAGHARIGNYCRIAGGCAINAVKLADRSVILGYTAISKDISEPGGTYSGYIGFMTQRKWFRWVSELRRIVKQR